MLLCFWLFAACFALCVNNASSLTMRERKDYKLKVKEMFYHGKSLSVYAYAREHARIEYTLTDIYTDTYIYSMHIYILNALCWFPFLMESIRFGRVDPL